MYSFNWICFIPNIYYSIDNWKGKKYKVNFDSNGGYIDISSKYVEAKYGDLPTPTKEGYTFKGWNGKNLFNLENVWYNPNEIMIGGNEINFDKSSVEGNKATNINIQAVNNNTFVRTISNVESLINQIIIYTFYTNDFNGVQIRLNTSKEDAAIRSLNLLEYNNNYTISFKIVAFDIYGVKATISDVQLEEGTKATEWEPYFITPDTKVVQKYEHTLTAVWEENE